jgi:hypothetical protein
LWAFVTENEEGATGGLRKSCQKYQDRADLASGWWRESAEQATFLALHNAEKGKGRGGTCKKEEQTSTPTTNHQPQLQPANKDINHATTRAGHGDKFSDQRGCATLHTTMRYDDDCKGEPTGKMGIVARVPCTCTRPMILDQESDAAYPCLAAVLAASLPS